MNYIQKILFLSSVIILIIVGIGFVVVRYRNTETMIDDYTQGFDNAEILQEDFILPAPNPNNDEAVTPSITVLSPNGGEILVSDQIYTVSYQISNPPDDIANWKVVAVLYGLLRESSMFSIRLSEDTGEMNWKVKSFTSYPKGEGYIMKLCILNITSNYRSYCDQSDNTFEIVPSTHQ